MFHCSVIVGMFKIHMLIHYVPVAVLGEEVMLYSNETESVIVPLSIATDTVTTVSSPSSTVYRVEVNPTSATVRERFNMSTNKTLMP